MDVREVAARLCLEGRELGVGVREAAASVSFEGCELRAKALKRLVRHRQAFRKETHVGAKAFGNDVEVPPGLFVVCSGHSGRSSDPRQFIVPPPGTVLAIEAPARLLRARVE